MAFQERIVDDWVVRLWPIGCKYQSIFEAVASRFLAWMEYPCTSSVRHSVSIASFVVCTMRCRVAKTSSFASAARAAAAGAHDGPPEREAALLGLGVIFGAFAAAFAVAVEAVTGALVFAVAAAGRAAMGALEGAEALKPAFPIAPTRSESGASSSESDDDGDAAGCRTGFIERPDGGFGAAAGKSRAAAEAFDSLEAGLLDAG